MITKLLDEDLNRYKANLHCHTTVSDGRLTPEAVKKLYKENGYSVIATQTMMLCLHTTI